MTYKQKYGFLWGFIVGTIVGLGTGYVLVGLWALWVMTGGHL